MAKPGHVIQLTTYSKLIGIKQDCAPIRMYVVLGDNERVPLRVSDFVHYHSIAQRRLETFANRPPETSVGEPCGHCHICRWSDHCRTGWEEADHLTLVANITRHQIRRFWEAGISTVRSLATLPAASRVPGVQTDTLNRLRHQATLQTAKHDTNANYVETLPLIPGRGFARLPRPDPGDIFFDMEGYPFFDDSNNLEYLFGFVTVDDGQPRFTPPQSSRSTCAEDQESERKKRISTTLTPKDRAKTTRDGPRDKRSPIGQLTSVSEARGPL